ncbi:unnamed protein product, partial [Musa textilis]
NFPHQGLFSDESRVIRNPNSPRILLRVQTPNRSSQSNRAPPAVRGWRRCEVLDSDLELRDFHKREGGRTDRLWSPGMIGWNGPFGSGISRFVYLSTLHFLFHEWLRLECRCI